MEGIYAVGLSNGQVKIGRSENVVSRLNAHAGALATWALTALEVWTCAVEDSASAERALIHLLIAHPSARYTNGSREVWEGITVPEVAILASAVRARHRATPPPPLADPVEPRGRDEDVLEFVLRAMGEREGLPVAEANAQLDADDIARVRAAVTGRVIHFALLGRTMRAYPRVEVERALAAR